MPTPRGWSVLAATIACLLTAWRLSYVELAVFGTAGVAALGIGSLVLLRRLPLRVRRDIAPRRVTRGEPALGIVTVAHVGRWATPALVASDRCGDTPVAVELPRLRRGRAHTATYHLPTDRRGEVPVGPLALVSFDPLGLFRRRRWYGQSVTLLVHPRTVALTTQPSGRLATVDGPTSDTAPGGAVTFHALREYAVGDDLRHVHWRTSARTGTLMVRHLVDASLPRTIVLLDNRPESYVDDSWFELGVDVAASVALAAAGAGFPLSVLTADGPYLETAGGRGDVDALLSQLALLGPAGATSLAGLIATLRPGRSGGSLTVVTGAGGGDGSELDRLAVVRRYFDRSVLARVGERLAPVPAGSAGIVIDAADLAEFVAGWRRSVGG